MKWKDSNEKGENPGGGRTMKRLLRPTPSFKVGTLDSPGFSPEGVAARLVLNDIDEENEN